MKHEPMTQEQLDAIQERAGKAPTLQLAVSGDTNRIALYHSDDVDALIAEVERLRALTTVDDAMVERAARVLYLREIAWSSKAEWNRLPDPVKRMWRLKAEAVLDAALGTGEGA